MASKKNYRYNEETLSFEPFQPKKGEKFASMLLNVVISMVLALGFFLLYAYFFDSPDARRLKEENDRMAIQYELLLRKTKDIEQVLQQLEQRDDNMYRAILQAEPVENRSGDLHRSNRYNDLSDLTHNNLVIHTSRQIDQLSRRVYLQSKSYDELAELIRNNEDRLNHLPAIQPVPNSSLKREASGYGWRTDPVYKTRRFHKGIDFSVPVGTDIYATADGVISYVGYQRGGYGHCIKIDHGYDYTTVYAHLKNTNKVRLGQKVKRGDIIGESGNSGKSVGPHLHYEVQIRGVADNPVHYFFKDLSPEEYDDMLQSLSNSGMPMD